MNKPQVQKSIITLFFCYIFSVTAIWSQTVPDFTITDTDNVEHNLYADYLDQGTTVVIKIFFVNCPPCNAIAPSVQTLYEEWGEGEFDVEFMELSNRSGDSNAEVQQYKNRHGLTFPGAGADGGSLTALTPYLRGDFGSIFGQPVFVVISPDGSPHVVTVTSSIPQHIMNVDEAIEATGATGGTPPTEDPATFVFDIKDAYDRAIPNVVLTLESEDGQTSYILDATQPLSITDLATEYPNIQNPYLRISKKDDILIGVTATDIFNIQRHILGKELLANDNLISAADVDRFAGVTATDLFLLQRLILGKETEFPLKDSYEFVPKEINISITNGQTQNLNFLGIKTGNVDGL